MLRTFANTAACLALVAACSLTQGADEYRTGGKPDAGAPAACAEGAADCNGDPADGCECAPPSAVAACGGDAGGCAIDRCNEGTADCNGAVADGCEVKLADDASHCGKCGRSCAGGACVGGVCQPFALAPNQPNPGQIVIDLDYVYWTNYGASTAGGGVAKVRNDGLNLTSVASAQTNAWGVAVDEAGVNVFWTTFGTSTSLLGRAAKTGAQAAAPATVVSMSGRIRGVALDPGSAFVYFALYDGANPGIYRIDRTATSGTPEFVAAGQKPNAVLVDETNVYWTNEGNSGVSGSVALVPKTATLPATPTLLATSLNRPRGLALDASTVYWSNAGSTTVGARDGSVERNLKSGSPAGKVTLATGIPDVREIAVDATHVYFTSYRDETIARVAKTAAPGSTPEVLAKNAPEPAAKIVVNPLAIAVDAKYIYWSNYGPPGGVMRLVK